MEFNSIEEIAADLAAGKVVVMLDNEDRENECPTRTSSPAPA